jgi:hypothetical protein
MVSVHMLLLLVDLALHQVLVIAIAGGSLIVALLEFMRCSGLCWCMLVLAQALSISCNDPLDHQQGLVHGLLICFIYLCSSDLLNR